MDLDETEVKKKSLTSSINKLDDRQANILFTVFSVTRQVMIYRVKSLRDVPGGPVVKTLPSSAGVVGSIPGLGAKIPHAS